MSGSKDILMSNNEKIIKCITDLKNQRNELDFVINNQQEEKLKLQTEAERITFKLGIIKNYDKTIKQAEESYAEIIKVSGQLLKSIQKNVSELEETMDKKTSTEDQSSTQSSTTPPTHRGNQTARSNFIPPSVLFRAIQRYHIKRPSKACVAPLIEIFNGCREQTNQHPKTPSETGTVSGQRNDTRTREGTRQPEVNPTNIPKQTRSRWIGKPKVRFRIE
ncbi:hypothetical protein RI129_012881 [Pyrocoelia pectoralis]|uniref:Uncharacterized protein n=1 Tax=Pyrocoelia pectoralis TaxID=417401 RepID=A0AAN7ZFD7_9COLE